MSVFNIVNSHIQNEFITIIVMSYARELSTNDIKLGSRYILSFFDDIKVEQLSGCTITPHIETHFHPLYDLCQIIEWAQDRVSRSNRILTRRDLYFYDIISKNIDKIEYTLDL